VDTYLKRDVGEARVNFRIEHTSFLLMLPLFNISCGEGEQALATVYRVTNADLVESKEDELSKICEWLGCDSDCDICEVLVFYKDSECDSFCVDPYPDCEVELVECDLWTRSRTSTG
jgi:hypothetical protein